MNEALPLPGIEILGSHVSGSHTWIRVPPSQWADAAGLAKAAGYNYFSFLSAIDWQPNTHLDGKHAYDVDSSVDIDLTVIEDPVARRAGGTSRFQVFGCLQNVLTKAGVIFLADLDESLTVGSWSSHFRGADWHERETWEMFGVTFEGHSGLRHIYLPDHFEGNPLRKDYPLLSREVRPWPGLVDLEDIPESAAQAGAGPAAEGGSGS